MMCILLMNDYPVKRIDEFIDDALDAAAGWSAADLSNCRHSDRKSPSLHNKSTSRRECLPASVFTERLKRTVVVIPTEV